MFDTGLEIRILRERLKMSAKDLAERVGLSQSQMSRLEKGQRRIDMKVLERIAHALEVHPSYFFPGNEPTPRPDGIPPTVPEAIGKIIRSERRQQHLSSEDLGRKVGRPKAVIESIEEGKRDLDGDLADRILKVLRLPSNYFLQIQERVIRSLEAQVERLNGELAEVSRGGASRGTLEVATVRTTPRDESGRREVPIFGSIAQGYPQMFDESGRPVADVSGTLVLPDLGHEGGFALHVVGDSMVSDRSPSFREGDLIVLARGTLRSRDFGFVRIDGEEATFRQVFFDAVGLVRLQPLNLNHAPRGYPMERVLLSWRVVAHVAKF